MIRLSNLFTLSFLLSIQILVGQIPTLVPQLTEAENFDIKGFHLDLRIQVMKPAALHLFAKQLVDFGINTLVMEWEASYPYETHAVISNELSYTNEEIESFIAYCDSIGLDVIPLQQCFGHVEYILRHDRYRELEEDPKQISQLCPREFELNKALFTDLFSEFNC